MSILVTNRKLLTLPKIIFLVFVCNNFGIVIATTRFSLETRFIELPIDHFTPVSHAKTFNLRYMINTKFYQKNGPIFVYTGGNSEIITYAQNSGFLFELSSNFNALLVFMEHRYYGQSLPFGNASFSSMENIKYLTTTQALADYARVIEELKNTFFESTSLYKTQPVIAFGGFYGGMLATWLRMKYPYLVMGAIASSSPIFYFPGLTNCEMFYDKVTHTFQRYGHEQCLKTIKLGWDVIINLTKTNLGMDFISSTWKLCKKLKTTEDVEMLLEWLSNVYERLAVENYHYPTELFTPLPAYPVKVFCDKLTTSSFNDTKSLIEFFGKALEIYTNYTGQRPCNNIYSKSDDFTEYAWDFQSCTEMIMPKCSMDADMFITKPWDYEKFAAACYKKFGFKSIRPDWAVAAYGGKNLEYYSNLIFSNGMMDPYSTGGAYLNFSNSIYFYNITDAPHNVDFRSYDPADNNYVLDARSFHIDVLKKWLNVI